MKCYHRSPFIIRCSTILFYPPWISKLFALLFFTIFTLSCPGQISKNEPNRGVVRVCKLGGGITAGSSWMRGCGGCICFLGLARRSRGHSISPLVEAVELWKAMMRGSVGNGGERTCMGKIRLEKCNVMFRWQINDPLIHPLPAVAPGIRGGGGSFLAADTGEFGAEVHQRLRLQRTPGAAPGERVRIRFRIVHRMAEGSEGEGDKRPSALQMRGPLSQ